MKKTIAILLVLGVLLAGVGMLQAASLMINANVQSELTLVLSESALDFDPVQPGVPTEAQQVTATTSGNDASYNLLLSNTTFARTGGGTALPANVLQYRLAGAGTYASGSSSATAMLGTPSTATSSGDEKDFDFRLNVASGASDGNYQATVTISATPL